MKRKIKKLVEPHQIHSKLGDTFEFIGDLFIVFLIILLFYLGFLALIDIGEDLVARTVPFEELIAKFIYVFILTELFRLMIIYLRERRVDVPTVIKTTLIAILREVIIKAPHYKFMDFIGIGFLLLVLGILLYVPEIFLKRESKTRKKYIKRYKIKASRK
ncbi:MAG: hypothetical protein GXO22_07150 [Aquificae bacterium]|nr:hypothetical protein [Aquificota bacterium]